MQNTSITRTVVVPRVLTYADNRDKNARHVRHPRYCTITANTFCVCPLFLFSPSTHRTSALNTCLDQRNASSPGDRSHGLVDDPVVRKQLLSVFVRSRIPQKSNASVGVMLKVFPTWIGRTNSTRIDGPHLLLERSQLSFDFDITPCGEQIVNDRRRRTGNTYLTLVHAAFASRTLDRGRP